MTEPLHVIIVGGGIAGLCLVQGLRQAGVSVAVYERDRSRTDRLDGYRIHINPAGSRALKACLPPPVWDSFVASAGEPGGLGFLTEQLRELVRPTRRCGRRRLSGAPAVPPARRAGAD